MRKKKSTRFTKF